MLDQKKYDRRKKQMLSGLIVKYVEPRQFYHLQKKDANIFHGKSFRLYMKVLFPAIRTYFHVFK